MTRPDPVAAVRAAVADLTAMGGGLVVLPRVVFGFIPVWGSVVRPCLACGSDCWWGGDPPPAPVIGFVCAECLGLWRAAAG